MSLPKLEVPTHKITLPVSAVDVTYRPFTVKEENIINMVASGGDQQTMSIEAIEAIRKLINTCTFDTVDLNTIPMPDIEYLFLKIKESSSGEITKKTYVCKAEFKESKCMGETPVEFFVDDAEIVMKDDLDPIIEINDMVKLEMGFAKFDDFVKSIEKEKNTTAIAIRAIANMTEKVYYGDEVYTEFTVDELIENILSNLTADQMKKISDYIDGTPKLLLKKTFNCIKCNKEHTLEIENLLSFFG